MNVNDESEWIWEGAAMNQFLKYNPKYFREQPDNAMEIRSHHSRFIERNTTL